MVVTGLEHANELLGEASAALPDKVEIPGERGEERYEAGLCEMHMETDVTDSEGSCLLYQVD